MHLRTIFYSLTAVLILATVGWVWADLIVKGGQISEQRTKLDKLEENFVKLSEVEGSYAVVKEEYATRVKEFDTLRSVIPDRASYVNVLESIRKLAQEQNVEIESFHPTLEDSYPAIKRKLKYTGKHVERRPIELRILGDYLTIGAFLEEILELESIVNIGRVALETELERGGAIACELVLFTYVFSEEVKRAQ